MIMSYKLKWKGVTVYINVKVGQIRNMTYST